MEKKRKSEPTDTVGTRVQDSSYLLEQKHPIALVIRFTPPTKKNKNKNKKKTTKSAKNLVAAFGETPTPGRRDRIRLEQLISHSLCCLWNALVKLSQGGRIGREKFVVN